MPANEEARLLERARGGDARAFSFLVAEHQQAVRGFLRRYAGDWTEADDIAQEAFVTAWERLDRFEGRSSFRSWVEAGEDDAPIEDRIALAEAMAELPEPQRAAVSLCLGEGFSHAEAAEALGLPLGTVKSHVARGKEKLLRAMGGA